MFSKDESGMQFGDYLEDDVFPIENSNIHKSMKEKIRAVEFVYLMENKNLLFIEAKSSSPQSGTNEERYAEFLEEITEKFIHSFNMLLASHLQRTVTDVAVGKNIQELDFEMANFVFVLVISGHEISWCLPLQDELKTRMGYLCKIWKSKIMVINDTIARDKFHMIK